MLKAHRLGWCYADYKILKISERKGPFLNNRDYCSLHPFNGKESAWIDDKLTLKYILNGTCLGCYMPAYYFQIDSANRILGLTDYPTRQERYHVDDVVALLEEKKVLAFKKYKASLGEGFIRVEYNNETGEYILNEKVYTRDNIYNVLSGLKDYLVMELLKPHPLFAKYNRKSVGCLRYVVGRRLSGEIMEILSFMRIGTSISGAVENYNAGGILTYVHDGVFEQGHVLNQETKEDKVITEHPDNGLPLKGNIPMWDDVKKIAWELSNLMPQMSYMGIDFCITDKNEVKILEINSLTSLDAMQLEKSVYETSAGDFFKERLRALNHIND